MNKSIFVKYYPQLLLLILAFTFISRTYRLHIPEKYMFDEVYHAVTAKLMVDGDTRAYEWDNPPPEPNTAVDWLHPPYAKLTQAASMTVFGKNAFGWRFSSVVFGVLVVWVTAKIAETLFKNKHIALLSAFLLSMDGLLFAMSRIAMNDVHVTFFILLSIWKYLQYVDQKRKSKMFLIYSSIAAGFAIGTKWSGVFSLGFIGFSEAIFTLKTFFNVKNKYSRTNLMFLRDQLLLLIVSCLIIPAILYIGAYSQMFLLGKDFNHLVEMHKNTWWYQTNLTATHPAQSSPLEWFMNTKPVWISVKYSDQMRRGDIYAIGNPALFWIGNIGIFTTLFTIFYSKFKKIKVVKKFELKMLALLLFAYSIVWLPWSLSPRIMFFYHYLPAVPLLSINLSFWLYKIWNTQRYRALSALAVTLIVISFIVLYPHLTLIPLSIELKNNVYFYFDFWKQP
jgi:dolichyl-phosphate-mannose-protein mannosyltransferase